jgi:hypothetical protein
MSKDRYVWQDGDVKVSPPKPALAPEKPAPKPTKPKK